MTIEESVDGKDASFSSIGQLAASFDSISDGQEDSSVRNAVAAAP